MKLSPTLLPPLFVALASPLPTRGKECCCDHPQRGCVGLKSDSWCAMKAGSCNGTCCVEDPGTTTQATNPGTTTAIPDGCPTSLGVMCVAWVRGNSGKIHALIKVGASYDNPATEMAPVNDANVVYETTMDGVPNTVVTTTTGDYVFGAYQSDYISYCDGGEQFDGVTENANCFETAPMGANCSVFVTKISVDGCPDATFVPNVFGEDGQCTFAGKGKNIPSPCLAPLDL